MSDTKTLHVAKIEPTKKVGESRAHFARGTKILLSDGSELSARDVTITTTKDGLWTASIEVLLELAPTFVAQAEVVGAPASQSAEHEDHPHVLGRRLDGRPSRFTDEARSAMRLVESLINAGDLVPVHDKWSEGNVRFVGAPMPSNEVPVAVQGAE